MTDIEIIEKYLSGELNGITIQKECLFMPVRITGLGETTRIDERNSLDRIKKEHPELDGDNLEELKDNADKKQIDISNLITTHIVDRNDAQFKNLENYNGLPILKEHPENRQMLNFENINDNPIIGTIVKPYEKDSEIWGIAKIYDLTLLDSLTKLQSTSPAVVSLYDDEYDTISEMPKHFNHLAFVEKGHWDQVSDKAYDSSDVHFNLDSKLGDNMAEKLEEKVEKLEEQEKKEGEALEKIAEEHTTDSTMETVAKDNKNPLVDEKEEKVDEKEEKVDEKEEEVDEKEEKVDEKEEEVDEECLTDEEETQLDAERWSLIKHFKEACDSAHSSLNVKMPHIDKRLNPSATISRILKLNTHLFNPKFDRAVDCRYDMHNYALQVDAFNDLLKNIEVETEKAYREQGKAKGSGFVPTNKDYIQVDKNF